MQRRLGTRAALVALALAASCGHKSPQGFSGNGGAGGAAGALGSDAGDPPPCPPCSADLHDVLDCAGKVLQTCPSDQGCADRACVPACEAARANESSLGCD